MGRNHAQPNTPQDARKLEAAAAARPQDPRTNTTPRGNGERDERDLARGEERLSAVLGH